MEREGKRESGKDRHSSTSRTTHDTTYNVNHYRLVQTSTEARMYMYIESPCTSKTGEEGAAPPKQKCLRAVPGKTIK